MVRFKYNYNALETTGLGAIAAHVAMMGCLQYSLIEFYNH